MGLVVSKTKWQMNLIEEIAGIIKILFMVGKVS